MPAKCEDTTHKQEEDLSEVINKGMARNTSTLLENAHSSEVLYFKRVAERSLNYSRHDLFMCHVLGSRTRKTNKYTFCGYYSGKFSHLQS